jgi:hypothetical protein
VDLLPYLPFFFQRAAGSFSFKGTVSSERHRPHTFFPCKSAEGLPKRDNGSPEWGYRVASVVVPCWLRRGSRGHGHQPGDWRNFR